MGKSRVKRSMAVVVVAVLGVVSADALGVTGSLPTVVSQPRFYLTGNGQTWAFSELKGITMETEPVEYIYSDNLGGTIHTKQFGKTTPPQVVLEKSLSGQSDQSLWGWHLAVQSGAQNTRHDVLLSLTTGADPTAANATLQSYVLHNAWPSKIEISGLKAGSTETSVETVTFAAESITTGPSGQSSVQSSQSGSTGSTGSTGTSTPTVAPATPHGPPSVLNAVSCPTATMCTAVGREFTGGVYRPLIEQWNGTTWSSSVAPMPAGATGAILNGVSCPTATSCTAVGAWHDATGTFTLAESWNGSAWSVQSTENIAGATTVLRGVSCASPSTCVAVGTASGPAQHFAVSEVWDGAAWKPRPVPKPTPYGPYTTSLASVSCPSATNCTSVGGNGTGAFAARWDGTTWTLQSTSPFPLAATAKTLNAIACTPGGSCTAVGSFTSSTGTHALVETSTGSGWASRALPTPTGTRAPILRGIACLAARSCVAVGSIVNRRYGLKPLVESWSARAWHKVPSPNPAGETKTVYNGVACATNCEAVGGSAKPSVTAVMQLLPAR